MNKINYEYKSVFREDINRFLKEKELIFSPTTIIGYSSVLKSFDLWCIKNKIKETNLNQKLINEWLLSGCNTKTHKVSVIRELAKNMIKYGKDSYIVPKKFYKTKEQHKAYIFSDKEIINFINALDNIKSLNGFIYRKDTLSLIFQLLIFTGARKSDVLNIKVKDINFKDNLIHINSGKNNIERIIPICSELMKKLENYNMAIKQYGNDNEDYFFSNICLYYPKRTQVSETSLFHMFRKILKEINIPYKNIKEGPRIHDFRFTFIVKSIQKLVKENKDLNVYLPILSKYVGHTTFKDTLYYFKPKELIFSKENYQSNSLIPKILEEDFDEE